MRSQPGNDYPNDIKSLRKRLGLTQVALAAKLDVSFPTVNRWEKGRSKPSQLAWNRLRELAEESTPDGVVAEVATTAIEPPILDFIARPEVVRALVEGERL